MGAVHLTVADLDRSIDYYDRAIGLRVRERDGDVVRLGVGDEDLLVLTEERGAAPADGFAGLFHFALLVPARTALARWLGHAARDRVQLSGLSDHFVSEAIYLRDPDHHGIEIYADRPRELWEGQVTERLTTLPLDVDDLLARDDGDYAGLPDGTRMGHVHLSVGDLERAVASYEEELGLEPMARYGSEAAFLAWDGYHHHLGANTWQSKGAPYAPPGRARLTAFEVIGPDGARLVDPTAR
jgi:catechol 2,3-dioxygenase